MVPIQRSYDSRVWVCLWGPLGLFADTSCWQRVVGRRLVLCIITEPRNSWLWLELSSVLNLLIVFGRAAWNAWNGEKVKGRNWLFHTDEWKGKDKKEKEVECQNFSHFYPSARTAESKHGLYFLFSIFYFRCPILTCPHKWKEKAYTKGSKVANKTVLSRNHTKPGPRSVSKKQFWCQRRTYFVGSRPSSDRKTHCWFQNRVHLEDWNRVPKSIFYLFIFEISISFDL